MSETTEAPATETTDTTIPAATEGTQTTEAPAAPAAPEPDKAASGATADDLRKAVELEPFNKRIGILAAKVAAEAEQRRAAERERDHYRQQLEGRQADPNAPKPASLSPANLTDAQIEERANAIAMQREYQKAVSRTIETGNTKFGEAQFVSACNTLANLGANEQPAFMQAVTELENGSDVLHHLGTNPELAARVMSMPPMAMMKELTKLEARITAPAPPKPVSRAPSPISPIDVGHDVDENAEPDVEKEPGKWMRWVAKQGAKK
jgi:hypothetical protein